MLRNYTSSAFIKATKRTTGQTLAIGAISSVILGVTPAVLADTSSPQTLKKVVVEADAINSYKAEKASSAKLTQPLVDTPQTLVVIKKELFEQQQANTLTEVLRNTPGITLTMGENGNTSTGDTIFMRGFDTQHSIYVDGIRDLGSISRDTFNTESVEITKGPVGADNGRGTASGYVNLASKMANLGHSRTGFIAAGTADYVRGALDINHLLNSTTALRLNVMKQDSGVDGRDKVESNAQGLAASLGLGLGTATRTHLNLLWSEQSGVPDGGLPTIGLKGYYNSTYAARFPNGDGPVLVPVDRENFYGSTSDYNDTKANMLTLRIEHDLAEGITLRNTSRYGRNKVDQVLTGVATSVSIPTDDTRFDVDNWTVSRSRQGKDQANEIIANQTNLAISFDAGGIQHDIATGVEFFHESQKNITMGLPYLASDSTARPVQVGASIYNPNLNDDFQPVVRDRAMSKGETTTYSVYVMDTLTFTPQWMVNLSARAEKYRTNSYQLSRQGSATPQIIPIGTYLGNEVTANDELFSFKVGTIYKPQDNGSIYLAYTTSQLPPGGTNFSLSANENNINNPNVDPQKGTNIELGTKWDLFEEKLLLTAAAFKSTNDNEMATELDGTSVQVGEKEVTGVELGLVGALTDALQINLGLTVMDTEITRGNRTQGSNSNNEGGEIQWSPKTTFTTWLTYNFSNGLIIGGGARYVDSMLSSSAVNEAVQATRSMLQVEDYWVVDAMMTYPISDSINLQLNLYNLTDEDYISTVNNAGNRYYSGRPFSARLGLKVAF